VGVLVLFATSVGRCRRWAVGIAMAGLLGTVTGCGAPEYQYVTNSDEKTYFKVPTGWAQVDGAPVDGFFFGENPDSDLAQKLKQFRWSVAYDSAEEPTAEHLLTFYPTTKPVLYSMVLHLPPALQGGVSLDYLRDMFFPVTAGARETYQQSGNGLPGFELLDDEVLTPSEGIRGVRVVYNYELPTAVHTFDVTAYTSNDSSVVYLFVIRCTARCYRDRAVELNGIATSFTVRSQS
jgi:hypothetical protein